MVDASSSRRDKSYPETLTHTGSPKGAVKLNLTAVPGRNPISKSLTDSLSSVKPEITAVSPVFMSATLLIDRTPYLD